MFFHNFIFFFINNGPNFFISNFYFLSYFYNSIKILKFFLNFIFVVDSNFRIHLNFNIDLKSLLKAYNNFFLFFVEFHSEDICI
jgi:hypothetical protein